MRDKIDEVKKAFFDQVKRFFPRSYRSSLQDRMQSGGDGLLVKLSQEQRERAFSHDDPVASGNQDYPKKPRDFIICPQCLYVSYHTKDIEEKYCVRCHQFHDDMVILPKKPRDPTGW